MATTTLLTDCVLTALLLLSRLPQQGPTLPVGDPFPGLETRARSDSAAVSSTTSSTSPTGRPGSWSMCRSSMLTPISPTSANSRASSPGWSGTETKTEAVASAGPPCLPGMAWVPVDAAGEDLVERRPRRSLASTSISRVEVGLHVAQDLAHRGLVGADDLAPHVRVAGRDPGDVAHALARQREVLGLGLGELAGGEYGEQVRQVRRAGHRPVVLDRREPHRLGAAQPGQRLDQVDRLRRGVDVRRDRPRPAVEERGGGGQRAGPLAAGHRVAADVAGEQVLVGVVGDLRQRQALHAADVGDDSPALERLDDRLGDVVGRHGDDGQLRGALRRAPGRRRRGRWRCARARGWRR